MRRGGVGGGGGLVASGGGAARRRRGACVRADREVFRGRFVATGERRRVRLSRGAHLRRGVAREAVRWGHVPFFVALWGLRMGG